MSKPVTKTLLSRIQDDIYNNRTPDAAKLRYHGEPIKVFLWDDMQDFKTMTHYLPGIDMVTGYRGDYYNARTVEKFLPWYNISNDWGKDDEYWPALCLEDPVDLEMVDCPEYCLGDLKPLKGKLVQVSLATFQLLDEYYDNEFNFSRVQVDVMNSPLAKGTSKAYTWMNTLEDIFYYEAHENSYKLKPNMDLTPFAEEDGVYLMGGTQ